MFTVLSILNSKISPWLVWHAGFSTRLQTIGSLVQFPVRAHVCVAGQVPSKGHIRGTTH